MTLGACVLLGYACAGLAFARARGNWHRAHYVSWLPAGSRASRFVGTLLAALVLVTFWPLYLIASSRRTRIR